MAGADEQAREPIVWRVPPVIVAGLFLIVCACAAFAIYTPYSAIPRIAAAVFAVLFLAGAIAAARMVVAADEEGIEVRRTVAHSWTPWNDVASIQIIERYGGSMTLRVTRHDGIFVDLPPTLLQPAKPTNKRAALAYVGNRMAMLERMRAGRV